MSIKISVDIPKFHEDINRVKAASGRSADQMLNYTMILLLQAGRSATKLGKKNRALVTDEQAPDTDNDFGRVSDDGPNAPAWKVRFFRVYKQGVYATRKVFVPLIPRKTKWNEKDRSDAIRARDEIVKKFKSIKYRGVARASWGWAMKAVSNKIRAADAGDALQASVRRNPIEVFRQMTSAIKSITVVNKLGWIRRIAPNIEQMMINSADARLLKALERILKAEIDKAQRRAA